MKGIPIESQQLLNKIAELTTFHNWTMTTTDSTICENYI